MPNNDFKKYSVDLEHVEEGIDDEAFASINLNHSVSWAKFVLTDDQPNANNERIPIEEFDNLVKTGVYMPIKMANGGVGEGHAGATPIGVITHLKKVKNQIIGLAALWKRERPEDIQLLKDAKDLQLSWEIVHNREKKSESGALDLLDTALRAVTLVGMPAYQGRTPVLAVASDTTKTEENAMGDLEQKVAELQETISKKEVSEAEKLAEITALTAELEALRKFKADVEEKEAEAQKMLAIKATFKEASIQKDDDYFETHKDRLLKLDKDELDFFVQEMVAFASEMKVDEQPESDEEVVVSEASVPALVGGKGGNNVKKMTPAQLGKLLREYKDK